MFKRENRYSFRKGAPKNVFSSPFFTIRYQQSVDSHFHSAIVVSKKVSMLATERNKLKRMMSEIVEESIEKDKMPYDLVFYLKSAIINKERDDLKIELKKALDRIH